jgi:hypothetical protein
MTNTKKIVYWASIGVIVASHAWMWWQGGLPAAQVMGHSVLNLAAAGGILWSTEMGNKRVP